MSMDIEEKNGLFYGAVVVTQAGRLLGPWYGGRYGIGTEWTSLEVAGNDLCCFMYWELDNQGIEDEELVNNILHGRSRSESDLIQKGEELSRLLEMERIDPFHIPTSGVQLSLF